MYKKGMIVLALFVFVLSAVACFQTITLAKEPKIDPMKLYIKRCSDCHDKNGNPRILEGSWNQLILRIKTGRQIRLMKRSSSK